MDSLDRMVVDEEKLRELVSTRIDEVERIVGSLQQLRQNLLTHAYQAKQSVLSAFSDHRTALQTREMALLNRIDTLLQSKDNAMVTQLSKLNQVLGCLRNCQRSHHPCDDCLEKFEDIDFDPISEISMEFSSADQALREAIDIYGDVQVNQKTMSRVTYDAADVTSWLLTPTNVKADDATSKLPAFDKTEWLTQNLNATHSAPSTDEHFLDVRTTETDSWLSTRAELSLEDSSTSPSDGVPPPSLYSLVFTDEPFAVVSGMPNEEWLRESRPAKFQPRERSESIASSLSTTSSAPSTTSSAPSTTTSAAPSTMTSAAPSLVADGVPDAVSVATTDSFSVIGFSSYATTVKAGYSAWLQPPVSEQASGSKYELGDWVIPSNTDWSAQNSVTGDSRPQTHADSDWLASAPDTLISDHDWLAEAHNTPTPKPTWLASAPCTLTSDHDWLAEAHDTPTPRPDWLASAPDTLTPEYEWLANAPDTPTPEREWLAGAPSTPTPDHDWLFTGGQSSLIEQLEALKLKGNFLAAVSDMDFSPEKADVQKSPDHPPRGCNHADGQELVSDWLASSSPALSVPRLEPSGTIAHMNEILSGSHRDWIVG